MSKFDVHAFAIVKIKVEGVEAETMSDALANAEGQLDYYKLFAREKPHSVEFAEEMSHYLVDARRDGEEFDSEIDESRWFAADGTTELPTGYPVVAEPTDPLADMYERAKYHTFSQGQDDDNYYHINELDEALLDLSRRVRHGEDARLYVDIEDEALGGASVYEDCIFTSETWTEFLAKEAAQPGEYPTTVAVVMIEMISDLVAAMVEFHQAEIDDNHGGDDSCSYCDTLARAKLLLANDGR